MGHGRGRLRALIEVNARGEGPDVAQEVGLRWEEVSSASAFLVGIESHPPEFVLLSLGKEGVDEELVRRIAEAVSAEDGSVLLSAPRPSLEWAVLARRLSGGSLLSEPLSREELFAELEYRLEEPEGVRIADGEVAPEGSGLVGSGAAMMEIVRAVARVGDSSATVLLTGESGTGKELVARALHWASPRRDGPFVAINCAAVPEPLLESEFFGHERGAFTGAVGRKRGRFERADGGTLFLDEVGDMSLVLQAKLLRTLEEREVERVGSEKGLPVDVRIVAATNRILRERVVEGSFRDDLFHRLAVAELHLPPLRERMEDLEELVVHFASLFSERYGRSVRGVSEGAFRRLRAHHWPGNVRELRNVVDRAVLNCRGGWIREGDLKLNGDVSALSPGGGTNEIGGYSPNTSLEEVERDHIARVLDHTDGVMQAAAEILGIHRNTLTRKVERYGLRSDEGGRQ